MALLRTLPNMTVLCPADAVELRHCLREALQLEGPAYIRIGKKGEPILHASDPAFRLGHAITMRDGSDMCFVAGGTILEVALRAADLLAKAGVSARVESFHAVKPLDLERLELLCAQYPLIAVAEEHGRIGGLYGAIAEWYALREPPLPRLLSFAVADSFLHEVGSQDFARAHFGLTAENMCAQVLQRLTSVRKSLDARGARIAQAQ
jgi:transketolase